MAASAVIACKVEVKDEQRPAVPVGFTSNATDEKVILAAAELLLRGGASPGQLYASLPRSSRKDTLRKVEVLLVKSGLHPDTNVGNAVYFLHRLNDGNPPPCRSGHGREGEEVTLEDLLELRPTPTLKTETGSTALHLLVHNLLSGVYFPLTDIAKGEDGAQSDLKRAEYLSEAFPLMLQAGYSATEPDAKGRTVVQLLTDGYDEYGRLVDAMQERQVAHLGYDRGGDAGLCAMLVAIRHALEACGEEAPAKTTMVMDLRMYKGRLLTEVPAHYIHWMCETVGFFDGSPRKNTLLEELLQLGLVKDSDDEKGQRVPGWAPAAEKAVMTSGKYKGLLIKNLDCGYIDWMCRVPGFFDDTPRKRTLKRQLLKLGRVREEADGKLVAVWSGKRTRYAWEEDDFDVDDVYGVYDTYDLYGAEAYDDIYDDGFEYEDDGMMDSDVDGEDEDEDQDSEIDEGEDEGDHETDEGEGTDKD